MAGIFYSKHLTLALREVERYANDSMVKRQPGRPSIEEFMQAASRLTSDDSYDDEKPIVFNDGIFCHVLPITKHEMIDINVIRREWRAAEPGSEKDILEFARNQLRAYRKLASENN